MDHRHVISLSDAYRLNQHAHNKITGRRDQMAITTHLVCVKYDEHRHDKMACKQLGQKD